MQALHLGHDGLLQAVDALTARLLAMQTCYSSASAAKSKSAQKRAKRESP